MATSSLPYRPCAGIMLLNGAGHAFVGQRIDTVAEAWQMPQGGIDPGEDPLAAAFRELEEEIGTRNAGLIAELPEWLHYDLPEHLVGRMWGGRYRGQAQKWFAMRFLGTDDEIDLATAHPEFRTWRWLPLADLPALAVPFKREVYAELVRRFAHLAD
ncbi:RNA pyrophosphohydrolase [Hankyongella ginsenosidimutans]|uniref:RNA pyrophosphohydrolase n=1 Tax=Hankyongella ginsenosidimutans TaxID=1763828 RepID=A0A4D7C2Z2_9SPHN|nr:RNA pyrophosphohydrolase [Hankyongella ginsenosidimutans]QCI79441.1 RNA pyrophosphohydrolase [Hankyongella ginsenosidimutans]TXG85676.1 MAG: RNA pyrophosphohydrolase [Sphingomonadales bacterium]